MNAPDLAMLPHLDADRFGMVVDPARTALVIIDIQVDFVSPEGLVGRMGGDMSSSLAAIDRIEPLIVAARKAGMTVAFMRVVTRETADHPAMLRLKARRVPPSETILCRAGSGGEDYYRLLPEPGDIEIQKPLFDSFHATDFNEQLQARGIDTLLLTGVSTDCCVDSTARRAFHLGYDVVIVSDACAASSDFLHVGALATLERNLALLVDSAIATEGIGRYG
jgi:nicotinamidase-related amidase